MSIERFFRRPIASAEWRSRAPAIRAQLEGLTIEELLRGSSKLGDDAGRRGRGNDSNQQRVPAGSPDGGQWTTTGTARNRINDARILSDEAPDDDWVPGAQYVAGHHWMAREFYQKLPFTREVRKIFRDATSGTLPHRIYSEDRLTHVRHRFDQAHRQYNAALHELITNYMSEGGITASQMTPNQAREFLQVIEESKDIRIRRYNEMIKFMSKMYRLRSGGRGLD